MTTKIPSIPGPPPGLDAGLRNWCLLVQEALGVRFNARAGELDQVVTRRDLNAALGVDTTTAVTPASFAPYAYGRFDGHSGATNPTLLASSGVTSVLRNVAGHWTLTFAEAPGNFLFMHAVVGGFNNTYNINIQWVPISNTTLDVYAMDYTGTGQDSYLYFMVFNTQ